MPIKIKYKTREDLIDECGPWMWIERDDGAWAGPRMDWETSHREKYTKYLKGTDVVFCAGGNQGMYPKLFSKIFKYVYTFEPDAHNFHCLVNNCQDSNIFKFNCALGSEHKMMGIDRVAQYENAGMHKMVEAEGAMVPLLKLDDFNPPTLNLIQLDVEGFEPSVLRGGIRLISTFKPVITCENGSVETDSILFPLGYKRVDQSVSDTVYAAE